MSPEHSVRLRCDCLHSVENVVNASSHAMPHFPPRYCSIYLSDVSGRLFLNEGEALRTEETAFQRRRFLVASVTVFQSTLYPITDTYGSPACTFVRVLRMSTFCT